MHTKGKNNSKKNADDTLPPAMFYVQIELSLQRYVLA